MGKIDKHNLELNTGNSLYPTTHNTTNRFALIATTDDDDYKTIIINNWTNKKIKTTYFTSILHITKKEAISDAGDTGHFFLLVTQVKNMKPARKPISVNLPDGSKIRSRHTCNL